MVVPICNHRRLKAMVRSSQRKVPTQLLSFSIPQFILTLHIPASISQFALFWRYKTKSEDQLQWWRLHSRDGRPKEDTMYRNVVAVEFCLTCITVLASIDAHYPMLLPPTYPCVARPIVANELSLSFSLLSCTHSSTIASLPLSPYTPFPLHPDSSLDNQSYALNS